MQITTRSIRNGAFGVLVGTIPFAHAAVTRVQAVNCGDTCADCDLEFLNCQACSGSGCDLTGFGCEWNCFDCHDGQGFQCFS